MGLVLINGEVAKTLITPDTTISKTTTKKQTKTTKATSRAPAEQASRSQQQMVRHSRAKPRTQTVAPSYPTQVLPQTSESPAVGMTVLGVISLALLFRHIRHRDRGEPHA